MKLKLVVVDLELSKRAKRTLVAALVPALVLGGGAIAYASNLHVWADGDTLNATDLNGDFSQLDGRLVKLEGQPAPVTITAWASYTPTVTAGGTPVTTVPVGSTPTGLWRRVGDTLEVVIYTSFPTCSTAGQLGWSLPSGLAVDGTKLPGDYPVVGIGFASSPINNTNSTTSVVTQGDGSQVVALNHPTQSGGLDCPYIGAGGDVRMSFAVPIQGWLSSN